MAASLGIFITFSSFGGVKNARAGAAVRDIPAQMQLVSAAQAFAPVARYSNLFGATERASSNIEPFSKWTDMFQRFETQMNDPANQQLMSRWQNELRQFKNMPLEQMARAINDKVNRVQYVSDSENWGVSDIWNTPVEFFQRGGDCEDYAIAKYVALRALGVPENRLRIAVVHDNEKNIPHAVLVVYTDHDALILDNQASRVKSSTRVSHYRPIFSINRTAWWLHTAPESTVIAASSRHPATQEPAQR